MACVVTFLAGKDKKTLNYKNCFDIGKIVAQIHLSSKKIKLYRKNSLSLKDWPKLLNKIGIKNIVDELNKLAEEHGEFYKPDPLLESMS